MSTAKTYNVDLDNLDHVRIIKDSGIDTSVPVTSTFYESKSCQ